MPRRHVFSALCAVAVFSASSMVSFSAFATSYNDYYIGGSVVGTTNVDTLQGTGIHTFEISSMSVTHAGNDLTVTINTLYAGHNGFEQTNYGALFIKTNGPLVDASNNAIRPDATHQYANDTSTALAGNFNYAVVLPTLGTGSASGSNATLYSLNPNGSNIQVSYWPNSSTNNTSNNSGGIFRNGQAVTVKNNPTSVATNESFSIVNDLSISFTISNFYNLLGSEFALAWAMTCGNDVIVVDVLKNNVDCPTCAPPPGETPVPGAAVLMGSVLASGVGFGAWRRRRRAAS